MLINYLRRFPPPPKIITSLIKMLMMSMYTDIDLSE